MASAMHLVVFLLSCTAGYGTSQQECQVAQKITKYGEVYIVGIFSMWSQYNQSVYDVEAMIHHLAITRSGGNQIGYVSYDICNNTNLLVEILLSLALGKEYRSETNPDPLRPPIMGQIECQCKKSNVLVVLGYMPEFLIRLTANILLPTRIPFCSNNQFSIFPDVANSHPHYVPVFEDGEPYNHLLRLITKFQWKNIGLITIGKDKVKFSQVLNETWNVLTNEKTDICVSANTNVNDIEVLSSNKNISVVIIWGTDRDLQKFLYSLKNITGITWIAIISRSFLFRLSYIPKNTVDGLFALMDKYGSDSVDYLSYTLSKITKLTADRWIQKFFNISNATDDTSLKDFLNHQQVRLYSYLYRILLVFSSRDKAESSAENTWSKSVEWIRNAVLFFNFDFTGLTLSGFTEVSRITFPSNEIPNNLYWSQNATNPTVSQCFQKPCQPGWESKFKSLLSNETKWGRAYGWTCRRCKTGFFKSVYGTQPCEPCSGLTIPVYDATSCYDPYKETFVDYKNPTAIFALALAGCGMCIALFIFMVFFKYRKTPCVKSTDSRRTFVQLINTIFFYPIFIMLVMTKPTIVTCTAIPFYVGLAFTLVCSITLAKTQRLLFAFQAKLKLSHTQVVLTRAAEVVIVAISVLAQCSLFAITLVSKPVKVLSTLDKESMERHMFCNTDSHLHIQIAFLLVLTIMCNIQAFRARTLPQNFNEAKDIVYAALITNLCLISIFPLYYSQVVQSKKTLVNIFVLLLTNIFYMPFLYSNKVYIILFQPSRNTTQAFRESMLQEMKKKVAKATTKRERKSLEKKKSGQSA
ncbi:vomeronasal type-2 receptor 116-like [Hydractinia symbiolongicarpus]|uniref:vomeronasal type-2 receptor 116-like n=1 Tax=Hydractinia symbiolongicarpus TaxID=13093 RepID=UPI00254CE7F8|nr:vomeronasal type-2 receptor 116-like [Hydractinia symbiolongicarpus]